MYENMTYDVILERMLSRVSEKFDKREGSLIFDAHSPTALELQFLYMELERMLMESYGDTASRDFLILRCRERGISPDPAVPAVLKGEFTPADVDVMGKRFNIGQVNYVVTKKIADGEYEVQCETAGTVGNQYFGSMMPIEYIEGLETAELTKLLIPGEEEEDTEALRQKYFDSFNEKSFGGNVRDYLTKVNAIPGVGAVKVARAWNNDISPAAMIPSESVRLWYEETAGRLEDDVKAWLDSVYQAALAKKLTIGGTVLLTILSSEFAPASDLLVQKVQEAVDPEENAGEGYGLAPIGHIVTVQSAQGVEIHVKTNLTFEDGYGWVNLQASINDAISGYLLELRKAWAEADGLTVRVSQIETRLVAIRGVLDVANTQINGTEGNLFLSKYQVPVFGGVSE